jgi:hypothetical protein
MSTQQKINIRNSVLILMIILAVLVRTLNINHITQWVTFTPIGAVAMFSGTYLKNKWKAFLVPIAVVFISDIALNYTWFHKFTWIDSSSVVVYITLAIMVVIGMYIKNVNITTVVGASFLSVLIHWLLTDIGPWLNGGLYAKGIVGYGQSLIAALPFEKSLLLGNLIFGAILFGGFELAKRKYTALQTNKQLAV